MIERIDRYITKSSVIKIYSSIDDNESDCHGIPVRRSRSLLVFQQLGSFRFNGYRVVRLKDIDRIRRGGFETTQQRILKSTGELENHKNPSWLRVGSWKSLLTCLKERHLCVSIERDLISPNNFWLGEISSVRDKSVVLNAIDDQGKWLKPKTELKYADITGVFFGDEYSVTFNEYVKSLKPKR